ncbi:MAG: threonine synthase [Spirochaetaceae bacterium]|jgi:threonine synthase|nr:threonine synthase [Spirochaetaceae bacterium]
MRYYSTRDKKTEFTFSQAVLNGLAQDGGLFVPQEIPQYPASVLKSLGSMSFLDIAFETIRPFVKGVIPDSVLQDIVHSAYTFDVPLVNVGKRFVLELFHGPTAAFKDFGARFMSRTFSYLRRGENKALKILVATSGDTGGAVADGFFGVEGITVTVLYPKGRVSPLQERQIAGLGGNISAIAVEGSFDDCQKLVKEAFGNADLKKRLDMSSANSINIARLIPQAIYYTAASAKIEGGIVACVPSGNLGNLTAGMYAQKMGAPIVQFIAASNINKTFPDYLESAVYNPCSSQATISNAMDVGAPSNFERMASHWSIDQMRQILLGAFVTDSETKDTISTVYKTTAYVLDPHGAVGWKAADILEKKCAVKNAPIVVLETAHPAKFAEVVEPLAGAVPLPESLKNAMQRKIISKTISADFNELSALL